MIDLTPGSKDKSDIERWGTTQDYLSKEILSNRLKEKLTSFIPQYKEIFESENEKDAHAITNQNFAGRIYSFAHNILQYALYARCITGSPKELLKGLYTHGRLMYICDVIREPIPLNPASHGLHFLISAAGKDFDLLHAYVKNRPLTTKFNDNLLSGLYAIIEDSPSETIISGSVISNLSKSLMGKTINNHTKGKLSSVIGILTHQQSFSDALKQVLDYHHRTKHHYDSGLSKYISLDSHALYTLAYYSFTKAGLEVPKEPNHLYWDSEFWHYVKNAGDKREHIIDIQSISTVLYRWLEELPISIDLQELISSLE